MPTELVPIDQLPAAARVRVTPDHPAFKDYAAQLEVERKLPPGTLTNAAFASKDRPALELLSAAANDQASVQASDPRATTLDPETADRVFKKPVGRLEGMTRGQKLAAGVRKTINDTFTGVGQLTGNVSQSEVDAAANRDKDLLDDPWAMTGAIGAYALPGGAVSKGLGLLGKGLGALGATRLAASSAKPLLNAAITGGALSAIQPVESGGSRAVQTGVGATAGLAGQGLVQGAKALVRPVTSLATDAVKDLANMADKWGINLRAADVSSNPVLGAIQHAVDYLPFSGGAAHREAAQKAFNTRLAQTMGASTDDLSAALKTTRPRVSGVYEDVLGRNNAELDPGAHGGRLLKAWKDFRNVDTSQDKQLSDSLDAYLTNLVSPDNGQWNAATGKFEMPGALYKKFRSEAGTMARSYKKAGETGSNPLGGKLAEFYNEVKQTLDHSIRTSSTMTPEDAAALKTADKHWGNMRTMENLSPKDASGDADFNALARVMSRRDANNVYNRDAMIYGTHDQELPDLARIGTQFLGRGLPPTNMQPWAKKLASVAPYAVAAPAIGGGLYSMNMHDDHPVLQTIGELGALALASKGMGSALNSQWFSRGAKPWIQNAVKGADWLGAGQLGTGAVNVLERRGGAPETFEEGAK